MEAANDELAAVQKQLTSAQELLQNCSDRKKAADEDYDEAVKKNKLNGQQTLEAKQQLDEKQTALDNANAKLTQATDVETSAEKEAAAKDTTLQQKQQALQTAKDAADSAAKTKESVLQCFEANEQAKREFEQAKEDAAVAEDACKKAQSEADTALQMWNEKQALAAQWKVNLQALASCDWENGQEFDLSLEEADERFARLNELIRAHMQAKKNQKAAEDTAETAQEWYSQLCVAVTKAKQEYAVALADEAIAQEIYDSFLKEQETSEEESSSSEESSEEETSPEESSEEQTSPSISQESQAQTQTQSQTPSSSREESQIKDVVLGIEDYSMLFGLGLAGAGGMLLIWLALKFKRS